MEYALLYAGIILPLTFMLIFVAELLWIWHSVTDFTRDGARYAATHCWHPDSSNVLQYMQTHVPRMIDMNQFGTEGTAGIQVQYFSKDPDSGQLTDFTCQGSECSVDCIPDAVSVSITSYHFNHFAGLNLPGVLAVPIPDFRTSMAVESGGCDEGGICDRE